MQEAVGPEAPLVLVVDDYEDTRGMLGRMLETLGCRVAEAANGEEAIARALAEPPDLVLMDLNMPVLDGFNSTLRIHEYEATRDVPVVAVTAYDTTEFRAAASAVGCCDYVVKPLDLDRLSTLLERLLPARTGTRTAGTTGGQ
jgi:two-component system, cell cycle response regulator DivK